MAIDLMESAVSRTRRRNVFKILKNVFECYSNIKSRIFGKYCLLTSSHTYETNAFSVHCSFYARQPFRYCFPFGRPEGSLKATLSLLERVLMKDIVTPVPPEEVRSMIKKSLETAALVNYTRLSSEAKIEGNVECNRFYGRADRTNLLTLNFNW